MTLDYDHTPAPTGGMGRSCAALYFALAGAVLMLGMFYWYIPVWLGACVNAVGLILATKAVFSRHAGRQAKLVAALALVLAAIIFLLMIPPRL